MFNKIRNNWIRKTLSNQDKCRTPYLIFILITVKLFRIFIDRLNKVILVGVSVCVCAKKSTPEDHHVSC